MKVNSPYLFPINGALFPISVIQPVHFHSPKQHFFTSKTKWENRLNIVNQAFNHLDQFSISGFRFSILSRVHEFFNSPYFCYNSLYFLFRSLIKHSSPVHENNAQHKDGMQNQREFRYDNFIMHRKSRFSTHDSCVQSHDISISTPYQLR